jgi:hypothetical protein
VEQTEANNRTQQAQGVDEQAATVNLTDFKEE